MQLLKNKKILSKIIIPLTAVFIIVLCWLLFLNMWTLNPSNDIRSVKLSVLGDGGYSDFVIGDRAQISEISDMLRGLQKEINITNITSVRSAEKFQKDPQFAIEFEYEDNSQKVLVHKDSVIIFNGTHTYFLQLEDMNTDSLINVLNSYFA